MLRDELIALVKRCMTAWGWTYVPKGVEAGHYVRARADALAPIGLHEARHTPAKDYDALGEQHQGAVEALWRIAAAEWPDEYGGEQEYAVAALQELGVDLATYRPGGR